MMEPPARVILESVREDCRTLADDCAECANHASETIDAARWGGQASREAHRRSARSALGGWHSAPASPGGLIWRQTYDAPGQGARRARGGVTRRNASGGTALGRRAQQPSSRPGSMSARLKIEKWFTVAS